MSKARDLANAGTALGAVTATELGYVDGVTSAIQTQIDAQIPKSTVTTKGDILAATGSGTIVRQAVGTDGQFLKANSAQADGIEWATVSQYALPTQTGNSGKFLTTNGTAESWGTVTTPIAWTQRLASPNQSMNKIEYNGTNLYVAVGGGGVLYTSSDGLTWTSRTSGFGSSTINSVFFGNGLWVAVGATGKITTSTDGVTWTARTSNFSSSEDILDVTYANSLWVAVGTGGGSTNTGGIVYSSDGITWTRKSQSIAVGTDYRSPVWNGTNWIVAADTNNNYLYATTPSGTWTAGATGSGNTLYKIIWDGTRHTTYETTAFNPRYSTSLTLGTTTEISNAHRGQQRAGSIYFYNNKIHINTGFYYATYTPDSSATVTQSAPILTPVQIISSSPYINNNQGVIWAGAVGIIFAGVTGIYTSF
jgi:hypothetical protein